MKNFAIIILSLMVGLVGCDTQKKLSTTNTKEIMKNREAINAFYEKALTVNSETRPTTILTPLLAAGFESSSSGGAKNAEQLMQQLEFFWKVVPDLIWQPKVIANDGDTYIVRSIATGTPNGDFMGVPTDGTKSFEIMTIDMHTMKDGKILKTHHVEDWATAMKQLSPKQGKASNEAMDIANAFMAAMGEGDMEKLMSLLHEDMIWQNAGDSAVPWIGPWNGKKAILEDFMPKFGAGFKTIKWEPNDVLSKGNTAAYFGQMIGELTNSGQQTKEFTYALRVKVKDGKVILWNWFEDSFEVSRAFHNRQ